MTKSRFESVQEFSFLPTAIGMTADELSQEFELMSPSMRKCVLGAGSKRDPLLSGLAANGLIAHADVALKFGADLDAPDERYLCALGQTLANNQQEMFNHLLGLGSSCKVTGEGGRTLLHVAAAYGRSWAVQPLVDRGVDISATLTDRGHETPLQAGCSHPDFFRACLQAGADPHRTDRHGQNLAHRIMQADSPGSMVIALECGISVDAKCLHGDTARQGAIDGNKQVAETIRAWETAKAAREALDEIMLPKRGAAPG